MRKSLAPSRKFMSPVVGASEAVSVNVNVQQKQFSVTNDSNIRKTNQILSILNKSGKPNIENDENINKASQKENGLQLCQQTESNKKYYNVVWGKKSTKKHKTWEGDGILEVGVKSANLKDLEGTEMGCATNIKTELITDGYIFSIGNKEVQVLDLIENGISTVKLKRPAAENNEKVFKKPKIKSMNPNLLDLNTPARKKHSSIVNFTPLILPQPSAEHQWNFNENKKPVTEVSVDSHLTKVLRPHQRLGVVFLYECILGFKNLEHFGAILADEMGLGKTLQCITIIWTLLKRGPYGGVPIIKRVLIVTPSSLTGNWQKEFSNWLGRERIQVFVVDNKNKPKNYIQNIPVMIISYEMFVRYVDDLSKISFDLLICDEGHRLKNNSIKASVLLNQINCQKRIILTGTPIQNDLQEFYALVDFVNPGSLGLNSDYRKYYEEPIVASRQPEADDDLKELGAERAKELNQKTRYFILRRTQGILDKYLPTKTETVIFCKSTSLQRQLYKDAVNLWENREFNSKDVAHLSVITLLKKICNHPLLLNRHDDDSLIKNVGEMSPSDSGKVKVLLDLLNNLSKTREKIVIVSSYTQTLDMLSDIWKHYGYSFIRLDGSVPSNQRTKIVDDFNNKYSKYFIFLLSSKAGGVGLNLVGASRLVLFDSDWNPATDLQAMSRIWRDGQKKSVYLYRFLTTGTIEEKIYQRQISKTDLSGAVVDPNNTKSIQMSDEELKDLFSLQFDTDCLTHSLLNCQCKGNGKCEENIKNSAEDDCEERKCQLGIEKINENVILKMNQLMEWEHYKQPINEHILKEIGFIDSDNHISFIFFNKCTI